MIFLDVDPSVVKPGWTPLIITILLAAAIALLMISMRRQIRKISAPRLEDLDSDRAEPGLGSVDQTGEINDRPGETNDQDEAAEATPAASSTRPNG